MKTIAEQIKWDFKVNGALEIRDKKGTIVHNMNKGHNSVIWIL